MNETLTASQDPFTSSLTGRKLGRYEVLARLASGGMAGVYVARAIGVAGFERLFAIKVLHPHLAHEEEFISMFLDEARLAARIRHPNVVPTIDISDTPDAGFYLVMEYIEGDHLGALLQRAWKLGVRMPWPITLRIVVDALDGLAAAHNLTDETGRRLNLVHRDVSPHNVMVSTDGIARITDFGVAKAEVRLSTTREGQFKGKLAYMAPEHASSGEADQRSDLFSMAIILWESLTGQRLFRAENHAATLNKICLEPIPMPSSVDPELAAFDFVLERGLARDPEQRFQSAEEFAEAIEQAAHTLGGVAKQREVAQVVREYAAEKISHDAGLIRNAIAQLALDAAAAIELSNAQDRISHIEIPAPPQQQALLVPPPAGNAPSAAQEELPEPSSEAPQRGWLWASLLFVLAAGIGLFFTLNKNTPEPMRVAPLPTAAETKPAATTVNAAVNANEPAAAGAAAVVEPATEAVPTEPTAEAGNTAAAPSATEETKPAAAKPAKAPPSEPSEPNDRGDAKPAEAETVPRKHTEPREGHRNKDTPPIVVQPIKPVKPEIPDDGLMINPYRR